METIDPQGMKAVVEVLVAKHGEAERGRAEEGVRSAASLWRKEDGNPDAFHAFCLEHFMPTGQGLEALFRRFEANFEEIQGSALLMTKRAQWAVHVDDGDLLPVDDILFAWNPMSHLSDDWFANKLLFVVRLNFPRPSLERKAALGKAWSRREWAGARLAEYASDRIPAKVQQDLFAALSRAESCLSRYNIHTDCLVDGDGAVFGEDKSLLMHWGMRDEIKAQYGKEGGLRRQRALYRAMERVMDGSIPRAVIGARGLSWNPYSNGIEGSGSGGGADGLRRYALMADIFEATKVYDSFSPDAPSLLARSFDVQREIPIERASALLESLFAGGSYGKAAARLGKILGRPLEAFDVWFRDFGGSRRPDEADLDTLTRGLYPDAAAFGADIGRILRRLGFPGKEADWLAERIEVDPARGSGHAMPAAKRSDKVRLRTRVGKGGMDYKGYNIAMHELGHNVEMVYSLHGIDEYFLAGVPNNAFTEAFAFVFQARDLDVLPGREGGAGVAAKPVLNDYWGSCEIAGVALVDIAVWRWLYAHPGAGPAELGDAVLAAARDVWNRLFAPAFGFRDSIVLAAYSHMIELPLYLSDYPLGLLVAFQVEDFFKGKAPGEEMGRMCRLGRLTPDEWMRQAVGADLSSAPLVEAAGRELGRQGAQ